MTIPSGPLVIDSATGSDTLASGLGPATAVNDTTESTTASYSGAVITFSGATDLSGVASGDILYLVGDAGVMFFAIASVNDGADTVTLDLTPTSVGTSGLSWAIGGVRASLMGTNSYKLIDNGGAAGDSLPGWIIELADGHSEASSADIDLRSVGDQTSGPIILRGESGAATKPKLQYSGDTNGVIVRAAYWVLRDLVIESTGSKTGSNKSGVTSGAAAVGMLFDGVTVQASTSGNNWDDACIKNTDLSPGWQFTNCELTGCDGDGIMIDNDNWNQPRVFQCHIHDNGGVGISLTGSANKGPTSIISCIIADNTGDGINLGGSRTDGVANGTVILGNHIYSNTGDGIDIAYSTDDMVGGLLFANNIITDNGVYGLVFSGLTDAAVNAAGSFVSRNAFLSNSSGHVADSGGVKTTIDRNRITLTADPYVDAANDDYNLNTTSGGGQDLRDDTVTMP